MRAQSWIKTVLVVGWVTFGFALIAFSSSSRAAGPDKDKNKNAAQPSQQYKAEDYAGSESCKACHEKQFEDYSHTIHGRLASQKDWKGKMQGCESCHGPGKAHIDGGGDKTKIRTFENSTPKQISETCLECHAGKEEHNNYKRGEHFRNDVGCTNCHNPHGEIAAPRGAVEGSVQKYLAKDSSSPDATTQSLMLRDKEPQLCLQCHSEMKAQFSQPFHHRVPEGAMKCSDCHNPHGGFEAKQARLASGADAACIKCHSDKQGPFVYEHAPVKIEGCTICHQPHGSTNPKLLKRDEVRQLCLECHSNTGVIGIPSTPSFHNQATIRFQNCTTCHVKIHGSQVNEFFFR
ncbi:MAG TPA: DmsE family decaheme c-type cytochrome [Blastocatellia bacterium]|nr:DmsE family decaheme c-type cytochrome [Blastocatellia bacterium]